MRVAEGDAEGDADVLWMRAAGVDASPASLDVDLLLPLALDADALALPLSDGATTPCWHRAAVSAPSPLDIASHPDAASAAGSSALPVGSTAPSVPLVSTAGATGEAASESARREAPDYVSVWSRPTLALAMTAAPNADTLELRRLKNRECMRRARRRHREAYDRLKATVADLEAQYAQLCTRDASELEDAAASTSAAAEDARGGVDKRQRQYLVALALAQRLRAENLYLKTGLERHASWRQHMHRILKALAEPPSAPRGALEPLPDSHLRSRAPPASASSTGTPLSRPMVLNLDVVDAREASAVFLFRALTDAAVARAIVDNAHETQKVRASLMAAVDAKDPRVKRSAVLGWDVIQRVRGNYFESVFTKTFADLDVHLAGQRMWANDMQLDSFRTIVYNLHRLDVLQRISANSFVLGRDLKAPDASTVFRSLFLRFRSQVTREIPNGSLPPRRASGFVIGSHSLNRDWSSHASMAPYRPYRPGDAGQRPAGLHDGEALEWADFAYATEFLTVEDPATGDKYHQIQWTAHSDFKSPAEAVRNASDSLTVCLRTEMLLFRPALELCAINDGETR